MLVYTFCMFETNWGISKLADSQPIDGGLKG